MTSDARTPEEYIEQLPKERREVISNIRQVIKRNLPKGFKECISYKMLDYVVPHSLYPDGYHCDLKLPLPFINLASQKFFVALYHSGIYADSNLHGWFVEEYAKYCKRKIDIGKSCIRFNYVEDIPYDLIRQLVTKMSPQEWISRYEKNVKKKG